MQKLKGFPASPGLASGPAYKFQETEPKIEKKTVSDTSAELKRFEEATRIALQQMCDSMRPPKKLLIAPKQYCTDNAVMVASLGYYKFKAGLFADLTVEPKASSS